MRIKSIFAVLLAIATMASCSDNNDDGPTPPVVGSNTGTAYMSLKVAYPSSLTTRADDGNSSELAGSDDENAINTLYVLTFDVNSQLIKHTTADPVTVMQSADFTTNTTNNTTTPKAPLKVNPNTHYLLIVANPGTLLKARLDGLAVGAEYTDIMEEIEVTNGTATGQSRDNLANEIRTLVDGALPEDPKIAKNFTMINAGEYDGAVWLENCLVDVSGNIAKSEDFANDDAAKEDAEGNPAKLTIERLAAKMVVGVKSSLSYQDTGAEFTFLNWVLDYRNSKFFPYAKKIKTNDAHTTGTYLANFYTKDPNYLVSEWSDGIIKNEVLNRVPNVTWNAKDAADYCIENTMDADEQRFGAATRVVIKGTYYPSQIATKSGDWFLFAGKTYYNLENLQDAYAEAETVISGSGTAAEKQVATEFKAACDVFLAAAKNANAGIGGSTAFADLTEGHLAAIENGGEITKIADCIRWYQGGVNYYTYEIRHNNDNSLGNMVLGKYGVVRNNWYNLTLTKVNGRGTPWFPGDGPEDPDPTDPIDQDSAFLDFEITVGPWVYWETEFEI